MRRWLVVLSLLAASGGACSGDPPDKEMQQAQAAIDAARTAGAERYAADDLTAAQQALAHARDAVAQRDYRLALSHAIDSRERAQDAAKGAADRKAAERDQAERALAGAQAALAAARSRLKAAEAAHAPTRTLAESRAVIATAEGRVQEARTEFEKGSYDAATSRASAAATDLSRTARNLEAQAATPTTRRRR